MLFFLSTLEGVLPAGGLCDEGSCSVDTVLKEVGMSISCWVLGEDICILLVVAVEVLMLCRAENT